MTNLEKVYYLDIDFLDYSKKNDIPNNIVYSESDINSTFIKAKLYLKGEVINLTDCLVTVGLRDIDDNCIVNNCEILNAELGEIKIPFVTSILSSSKYNKFDISIAKEDRKIVSPSYRFKIAESVVNGEYIEGNPNYDILVTLIDRVQNLLDETQILHDDVVALDQLITTNETEREMQEEVRQSNEALRISQEDTRKSEEVIRQANEEERKLAESTRIESENIRISSEDARNQAENIRISQENVRESQEGIRVQAETIRNSAEELRIQEEDLRKSQEVDRINAENLRIQSEEIRNANETVRESNETERMVAEEDRNARFLVMEDKVDKFIRDEAIWEVVEG